MMWETASLPSSDEIDLQYPGRLPRQFLLKHLPPTMQIYKTHQISLQRVKGLSPFSSYASPKG